MKEGRKEGMICGREPEGREETKAFQAEGWPEQRLDVHREIQAVHRYRGRVERGLERQQMQYHGGTPLSH